MPHTVSLDVVIVENNQRFGRGSYSIDVYHPSNFHPMKLEVNMVEYADGDGCEIVDIKEVDLKASHEQS